jgi:hypothetical protein
MLAGSEIFSAVESKEEAENLRGIEMSTSVIGENYGRECYTTRLDTKDHRPTIRIRLTVVDDEVQDRTRKSSNLGCECLKEKCVDRAPSHLVTITINSIQS